MWNGLRKMNRNQIIIMMLIFFVVNNLICQENNDNQFSIDPKDPKENLYSLQIEEELYARGYLVKNYEDFLPSELFFQAYEEIYNSKYDNFMPDKISYLQLDDGLNYCMLYDRNHDNPPLLTYLIFDKTDKKIVFYKINYNLNFSLIEKQFFDPLNNWELSTRKIKVFY